MSDRTEAVMSAMEHLGEGRVHEICEAVVTVAGVSLPRAVVMGALIDLKAAGRIAGAVRVRRHAVRGAGARAVMMWFATYGDWLAAIP